MSRLLTIVCCCLLTVSFLEAAEPEGVIQFQGLEVKLEGVSKEMRPEAEIVITKQLKLSEDTKLSAPLADDLAFFLQRRYAQSGYDQAQVEWELQDPQMILQVTENARVMVGKISLIGVDESLLETLQHDALRPTREREKRSETSTKPLPFVESELKAGADLVKRRLQAAGYLDATVAEPVFHRDEALATVDMELTATLGQKYVFGAVSIEGAEAAPDEAAQKLEASLLALKDQPYNEVSLETLRKQIKADYEARGYFGVEVTATADRALASDGVVPAVVQAWG